jgi:hypothetical protein
LLAHCFFLWPFVPSGDHSLALSDACTRNISSTLTRMEQSVNLTGALLAQTLHTVQDNSSNVKIAQGHFDSTLPQLDAAINSPAVPQIKASS